MNIIEVDQAVSEKLTELAKPFGITRNDVLRKLLNIDDLKSHIKKKYKKIDMKAVSDLDFKNIQDKLIPFIIKVLYENGGKATKSFVEDSIFKSFQHEFEKPYYHESVAHGVPRWKHTIAWSKERAKQIHGFIKNANESGRGIWELTDNGISYYENNT